MNELKKIDLLRALCAEFGPSGCEGNVADFIEGQLRGVCETRRDRMGNVIAHLPGKGKKVMLSAHMDEVGMMITDIDDKGYLRFANVGSIDARVLCGRAVTVGNEQNQVPGVIGAKAIHLQSADERKKATAVSAMYIDIGASSREEAEKYVDLGDFAAFASEFVEFGEDGQRLRGKAIDDRWGCAVAIETLRALAGRELGIDLYAVFSVHEEMGKSGAKVAAYAIRPDAAIVLEATAIADLPDTAAAAKVGEMGKGGLLSFVDKGTVYDAGLIDFALETARRADIPVQLKRYSAGTNDSAQINRAADGARALALSAPTRYIHSGSCVADARDFDAICALLQAMLTEWKD